MRSHTAIVFAASAVLLTACGGGSSSGNGGPGGGGGPAPDSLAGMVAHGERIEDRIAALQSHTTTMPTSGTGTYRGVAGFVAGDGFARPAMSEATLVAQAELTADFGARNISGELTNFRDDQNQRIEGSMQIRNGTGLPGANTYHNADVMGSLNLDGTPSQVNGRMDTQFIGSDAELLRGNFRNLTIGGENYRGGLVAER